MVEEQFESVLNAEDLRIRAVKKYSKSVAKNATKKLNIELQNIDSINKLNKWCECKGISVVNSTEFSYIFDHKILCIDATAKTEVILITMLHEMGHYMIGRRLPNQRFGLGHSAVAGENRTKIHKCDIVEEEFEAWHRGWRLSKKLKIKINKKSFDKRKTNAIMSYMKWALKVEGYCGRQEEII